MEKILPVIITLVAGGFGFLLRGYSGAYISEKGKNLATKEDINQITAQVESVKVSLQTLGQLKTDYEQQRREWLLSFYDLSVEIFYEKLGINFGDLPMDDGRSLFEFQVSFGNLVASMVKAYQRIVLYFEYDDPLRIHAEKVLLSTLDAKAVLNKRFGPVKITQIEENAAFVSGNRQWIDDAVNTSNEANKAYWDDMRPIVESFQSALCEYLSCTNKFLRANSDIKSRLR